MRHTLATLCLFTSLGLLNLPAWADGAATYQKVCAACHGQGVAGAPRTGDPVAWKKLIAEGQIGLTADGYLGVRAMPAKGGQPDLTLTEFAAAVVYMANQAGANWQEPGPESLQKMEKRIAQKSKAKPAKP